jgi:large subunit ribosomal protein L17
MRHRNKGNALGRKSSHKKAMMSNMACSLIEHKRITTTVAKAKELRVFVEPLITKSKTDSTHSRRTVFSNLKSKDAVSVLFRDVAPKVATREGGYTRIIRLGTRHGDAAEMCMIELVDFNELLLQDAKTKTRRSRRGGKRKTEGTTPASATVETATAEVDSTAEAKQVETPEANVAEAPTKEEEAIEATESKAPTEEAPKESTEGPDSDSDDIEKKDKA